MDTEKIQLLLSRHGKSVCDIARDLSVGHSVVSRTISNSPNSSRRVRLHISKIVGFMPSAIFDLSPKSQIYENYLYVLSKVCKFGGFGMRIGKKIFRGVTLDLSRPNIPYYLGRFRTPEEANAVYLRVKNRGFRAFKLFFHKSAVSS